MLSALADDSASDNRLLLVVPQLKSEDMQNKAEIFECFSEYSCVLIYFKLAVANSCLKNKRHYSRLIFSNRYDISLRSGDISPPFLKG